MRVKGVPGSAHGALAETGLDIQALVIVKLMGGAKIAARDLGLVIVSRKAVSAIIVQGYAIIPARVTVNVTH